MNALNELLESAQRQGLRLFVEGGRLRCLAPNGRVDPSLLAGLSKYKESLVRLLDARSKGGVIDQTIDTAEAPMSALQQSLFYEYLLDPNGSAFHMCFSAMVDGPLDLHALQSALDGVIRRHPSLRTTYHERDGDLVQQVRSVMPVDIAVQECKCESSINDDAEQARRPFDLENGPPLRVRVQREHDHRHRLSVDVHHIACDAVSLPILIEDLRTSYNRVGERGNDAPSASACSYLGYVQRQQSYMESAEYRNALDYWRRELDEAWPQPDFGAPQDPAAKHRLDSLSIELDASLVGLIDDFAATERCSRFEILFTSLFIACARQMHCDDVMIAMTSAGRTHPADARTVGCFTNLLPVRLRGCFDRTSLEVIKASRLRIREALVRQEVPFSHIRRLFARRVTGPAGIDISFTYVPLEPSLGGWRGLTFTSVQGHTYEAKSALHLQLTGRAGGLVGSFQYMPALMQSGWVESLRDAWLATIDQLVAGTVEASVLKEVLP